MTRTTFCLLIAAGIQWIPHILGATVSVDTTARNQEIDGFGTFLSENDDWFKSMFFDQLRASIGRIDITPSFVSPYSDLQYNSPWFYAASSGLPGEDGNNARTYTGPNDYSRTYNGYSAPIAVMTGDLDANIRLLRFGDDQGRMIQEGLTRAKDLGDFKVYGSMWSPAPWVKISSGNSDNDGWWPGPTAGTSYPFIWAGGFAGGKLDVSGTPLAVFNNTSSLDQFAWCTASVIRGWQKTYNFTFYAISLQNELTFEEFYGSATYPLSSQYLAALKAVKAVFNMYDDLKNIHIAGPEDLMGGDPWGLWQYGSAANPTHKNLQFLAAVAADPEAKAALTMANIHGYAPDGVSSGGANPQQWLWWADGWTTAPGGGLPDAVSGFTAYGLKSWMTETSGEDITWLSPASGFPSSGGFSVAIKVHQALTAGRQSGWIYWQLGSSGGGTNTQSLTGNDTNALSPKLNAFKHFTYAIRPGSVVLNATSDNVMLLASSYIHDSNNTLTVVLINTDSNAVSVTVNVPTSIAGLSSFDVYSSSDGSMWAQSQATASSNQLTVNVAAYGVVTLYGQGSPPTSTSSSTSSPSTSDGTSGALSSTSGSTSDTLASTGNSASDSLSSESGIITSSGTITSSGPSNNSSISGEHTSGAVTLCLSSALFMVLVLLF